MWASLVPLTLLLLLPFTPLASGPPRFAWLLAWSWGWVAIYGRL